MKSLRKKFTYVIMPPVGWTSNIVESTGIRHRAESSIESSSIQSIGLIALESLNIASQRGMK